MKDFILPPGYRLELVLSDPIIQEPTAIAFDGNGRMFVVEDRSYMIDADMTGQLDPISRISLHVDTNNDGVYDKHTAFVDNMVFPRFVVPFGPAHDPDEGIQRAGAVEVHRHEPRRRGGQEGALRHRLRPAGEHRRPGRVSHLDARQLDVQHVQRVPRAVDAARRASRNRRRRTAASGASPRTTTARSGSRAARPAYRSRFSFRSCTGSTSPETSRSPTSTNRTSGFRGAHPCGSPTCRAALARRGCPMDH